MYLTAHHDWWVKLGKHHLFIHMPQQSALDVCSTLLADGDLMISKSWHGFCPPKVYSLIGG